MRKKELITIKQAEKLKELGFNEKCCASFFKRSKRTLFYAPWDANSSVTGYISIPTVDEAIDWLRRKFNICIYSIEPFVDPTSANNEIVYKYKVKYCNRRDGWNGRVAIGETRLYKNVYSLKREAITMAIKWIKQNLKK